MSGHKTDIVGQRVAHVGLPKAGSTYLQKHFLPQLAALGFNCHSTKPPFSWPQELDAIYAVVRLWWGEFLHDGQKLDRVQRESQFHIARGQRPILMGNIDFRGFDNQSVFLSSEGLFGYSIVTARLIGELLKSAGISKIIFIYRKQADWSVSLWRQLLLRDDFFARYVSFSEIFGEAHEPIHSGVIDMDWAGYHDQYCELFGSENVLSLPYELMLADPQAFFDCVKPFIGVSVHAFSMKRVMENPSHRGSEYKEWRFAHRRPFRAWHGLRARLHRYARPYLTQMGLDEIFFRKIQLEVVTDTRISAIMQQFETSNRRLANLTGFDLSRFGYY